MNALNKCLHSMMVVADGSDAGDGRRGLLQEGSWDAIHVIEARIGVFLWDCRSHITINSYQIHFFLFSNSRFVSCSPK